MARPRGVVIGNIYDGTGAGALVGATKRNPCIEWVDYLKERGELSAADERDMRRTYTASRDADTEWSCWSMLRDRIRKDKQSGRR